MERVDTRTHSSDFTTIASNTAFLQPSHLPEDKEKGSEENKQFGLSGKRKRVIAL